MISVVRRGRSMMVVAGVCAVLQGCGCDTWGCVDGLLVKFNTPISGPYQVQLFVAGVEQTAPPEATCAGSSGCAGAALFRALPRDNVSVRITTSAGTRTTDFPRISYTAGRTDNCHDCQGNAEITAQVP